MTAPYSVGTIRKTDTRKNPTIHPLEDPLNYGSLAEMSGLFESTAKIKTWLRKRKRIG